MTEEAPTAADYASIERAAQELRRRGWREAFSPNDVIDGWASFIEAIEQGYEMTIDDYTNDLSIRHWAEEARPFLTARVAQAMDDRLARLDARFREATVDAARTLPGVGREYWWGARLPRVLGGELAEDVDRMGLRPDHP